jgi:hypothetical protein
MEREMLNEDASGVFKWHRTWNLPSISVLTTLGDKNIQLPKGLHA